MGYDLHITRRKDWFNEGDDITKEEFLAYIRSDPEFTYPSRAGDDYADWKSPKTGYETWLSWQEGRLQTKNPEAEFVDKLVAVARALGAKAQGDDGEVYLSSTQVLPAEAPPDLPDAPPAPVVSWPLWKQLLLAFLLGCVALAVKLAFFR